MTNKRRKKEKSTNDICVILSIVGKTLLTTYLENRHSTSLKAIIVASDILEENYVVGVLCSLSSSESDLVSCTFKSHEISRIF
jgi:hypothetical protein